MNFKNNKNKWSARFTEPVHSLVQSYTASINFDQRLALYDIQGSLAHAEMLKNQKIITVKDFNKIKTGLLKIEEQVKKNTFQWKIEDEDVHFNIEKKLIHLVGEAGKKLHTGRSRNDQIATDLRLFLRDITDDILKKIKILQKNIVTLAEKNIDTLMPGLTHLQIAQPISFAHHLLAYFEMVERDKQRFIDARKRINILPLGSAALAGTTYPINRAWVAKKLKFNGVAQNSIDAVSDRDFAIEFSFNVSIMMMHLSRFSEELIMWMSPFFGYIKIADQFCTGSSIMPQKKNPDVPELIRGKVGRVYGNLMSLLTLMKAQPLAYNKDNQEDKEPVFDSVDTIQDTLTIFAEMVKNIKVDKKRMASFAGQGFSTATDLADYLVKKGMPFRESHEVVSAVVQYAEQSDLSLEQIEFKKLKSFSKLIEKDIYQILTISGSVNARQHEGGTAISAIKKAISKAKKTI